MRTSVVASPTPSPRALCEGGGERGGERRGWGKERRGRGRRRERKEGSRGVREKEEGERGKGGIHNRWRRDKGSGRNREEERKKRERKEAMTEAYSVHIHVTKTDKQSCIYNLHTSNTHTSAAYPGCLRCYLSEVPTAS